MQPQTMGDRVLLARTKRGLNQRDLAKAAEVSPGWVSMLEQQKHIEGFGLAKVNRIASKLRVPLDWIVNGGEEPKWDPLDAPLTESTADNTIPTAPSFDVVEGEEPNNAA